MGNYPLVKANKEGNLFGCQSSLFSEEYCDKMCDLYIHEEVHQDEKKRFRNYFRLRASRSHNIESALAYDIICPHCKTHRLKLVGRMLDSHNLGLYTCPFCNENK